MRRPDQGRTEPPNEHQMPKLMNADYYGGGHYDPGPADPRGDYGGTRRGQREAHRGRNGESANVIGTDTSDEMT